MIKLLVCEIKRNNALSELYFVDTSMSHLFWGVTTTDLLDNQLVWWELI